MGLTSKGKVDSGIDWPNESAFTESGVVGQMRLKLGEICNGEAHQQSIIFLLVINSRRYQQNQTFLYIKEIATQMTGKAYPLQVYHPLAFMKHLEDFIIGFK